MKVNKLNKSGLYISEVDWDKCYKSERKDKLRVFIKIVIIRNVTTAIYVIYKELQVNILKLLNQQYSHLKTIKGLLKD